MVQGMDYFQILNLQREPFSNSPEPDFFFKSDQHRGCLQKLELAVRLRRGLNVVMGDVGTGKTTLCRQLILNFSRRNEDREQIETHLILDPLFSNAREFLSAVALLLGLAGSSDEESEWQLKENIKDYLFTRGVNEGKTVVLIIDEGQKLPDFCLETLREFLNYETNEFKLLQIVIFAQMEFEQILREHNNFADRVNQYYFLKPLNFRNSREMIKFRINRAGSAPAADPALFTFPALWAIYRATGGYPRKIITLCHQVMLAMIIQNRAKAGFFLVRACAGRVSPPETARRLRWVITAVGFVLLLVLAILLYSRAGFVISPHGKVSAKAPSNILPVNPPAMSQPVVDAVVTSDRFGEVVKPPEEKAPDDVRPGLTNSLKAPEASKKYPEVLGRLIVKRNDCILRMLERIYGKGAFYRLEAVAKANPQIKDLDRVIKGDIINIPVLPRDYEPPPRGKYRVQIASPDNLREAYELLTEAVGLPALILLPYWNKKDGLVFAVLLQVGFADETAAISAVKELPPPFTAGARVVKEWTEDTVFL
jgi:general secretion pathway protein A